MKRFALIACLSSTSGGAAVGMPQPFTCRNTSSGRFLYSVDVATVDGRSVATVRNQAKVNEIATRLGVPTPAQPFDTIELESTPESCESNDRNPFAMRCHPELSATFVSDSSGERAVMPLAVASVWVTRHVHETAFGTWDEVELGMGLASLTTPYKYESFMIDHPQCAGTGIK